MARGMASTSAGSAGWSSSIEMEKNIVKARHKKDMWWAERERAAEREYEQKKLQWQLGANARLREQQEQPESKLCEVIGKHDRRLDEIEALKIRLAESRAREEALHRVIRDNVMRMSS